MNYILCLLIVLVPGMIFFAYRQGLKDGKVIDKAPLPKIVSIPKPAQKPSKEEQKIMQILENVETYDGTSKGQKKVK